MDGSALQSNSSENPWSSRQYTPPPPSSALLPQIVQLVKESKEFFPIQYAPPPYRAAEFLEIVQLTRVREE